MQGSSPKARYIMLNLEVEVTTKERGVWVTTENHQQSLLNLKWWQLKKTSRYYLLCNVMKIGEVILPLCKIMYTLVLIIMCIISGLQDAGTMKSKVQTSA